MARRANRTLAGRPGSAWPPNGEWGRASHWRAEGFSRFLVYALNGARSSIAWQPFLPVSILVKNRFQPREGRLLSLEAKIIRRVVHPALTPITGDILW